MIWKTLSIALALCCILLVAVIVTMAYVQQSRKTDPRLLGTWISDGPRTLENLRQSWQPPDGRLDGLENLLGKMTVTYTETTITTDLNGVVMATPYTVLDKDPYSVALRDDSPPIPELPLSRFGTVHFDGEDAYFTMSEVGGFPEYFRRIAD